LLRKDWPGNKNRGQQQKKFQPVQIFHHKRY